MIRILRYTLALPLLFSATLAQAQVNKCVDAAGKTVYSQSPCPANTKSSNVRQSVPAGSAAPAAATGATSSNAIGTAKPSGPKTTAELEQEFRKRQTEQAEAQKKTQDKVAETKGREENCRASRAQLASLEIGGRQTRTDEKGERYTLDDSQTSVETEKARKSIQEWCK